MVRIPHPHSMLPLLVEVCLNIWRYVSFLTTADSLMGWDNRGVLQQTTYSQSLVTLHPCAWLCRQRVSSSVFRMLRQPHTEPLHRTTLMCLLSLSFILCRFCYVFIFNSCCKYSRLGSICLIGKKWNSLESAHWLPVKWGGKHKKLSPNVKKIKNLLLRGE